MSTPDLWLESAKELLKTVIRERGFTQLRIQEQLGWGRSYISQALNEGKELRLEVVLQILFTIGVDPGVFFARLHREIHPELAAEESSARAGRSPEVEELRRWVTGMARLLADHHAVPANDLEALLGRKLQLAGASPIAEAQPKRKARAKR